MRAERGFTLVEVLVALVVTSALLAVVLDGSRLARERSVRAAEQREGVLLARHLLRSAAAERFEAGVAAGREGALDWRLERSVVAADPRGRSLLAGFAVAVTADGGRPVFRAETRRLVVAGAGG